jgi:hypothetical protein
MGGHTILVEKTEMVDLGVDGSMISSWILK